MTTNNQTSKLTLLALMVMAIILTLITGPIQVDALPIKSEYQQEDPGFYQLICSASLCNGGSRLCSIISVPSSTPGLDYRYPCFEPSFPSNELDF